MVSAVLRSIPNFINRTRFAFWSMIPVVIGFVFLLILLFIKKNFKNKHTFVYENIFCAALSLYTAASFFYYLPVIVTLADKFVNYGESAVSTIVLYRVLGYLLGFTVIVLSALAIYKTLIKLSDFELKVTVAGSLIIFGITQINVIVQRLYSLRIIPRNDFIFKSIAFTANHHNWFVFGVILFVMFPPILLWKKNMKITEPYSNNAQLRKIKAGKRNAKRWSKFSIFLLIINIFSLTILRAYINREVPLSPPENYVIEEGLAHITLEELEDGKLHRYEYITEEGISVRFIVIKKSEGAYGVGLDACDICGPGGYFERNGEVICKLCDVVMNKGTIGFPGGCNPVPLSYIVHGGKIKIKITDLKAEAYRFR